MTTTVIDRKANPRARFKYPSVELVDGLLTKFRGGTATEADLTLAVDVLAKAGIRCSEADQKALRNALAARC